MCLGIPMQVLKVDGIAGHVQNDGATELIDLSLTPQVSVGDWVLTFLGAAREVISQDEAHKIKAALDGLRAVMEGGDVGDAFADLDARAPTLPPHLQAAFEAGKPSA